MAGLPPAPSRIGLPSRPPRPYEPSHASASRPHRDPRDRSRSPDYSRGGDSYRGRRPSPSYERGGREEWDERRDYERGYPESRREDYGRSFDIHRHPIASSSSASHAPYQEYPQRGQGAQHPNSSEHIHGQYDQHMAQDQLPYDGITDSSSTAAKWERGQEVEPSTYGQRYGHHQADQYTGGGPGTDWNGSNPRGGGGGGGGGGGRGHGQEVSRDVIFLGLDPNMTDTDLLLYLRVNHAAAIDTTTIIKDKQTGLSKGFGFALFSSLTGAEEFLSKNWPNVHLPPLGTGEARTVKVDYSSSSSGNVERGGGKWEGGRGGNDGMRDIGPPGNGNRSLLIRGLDGSTQPEAIRDRLGAEIVRLAAMDKVHPATISDGRAGIKRIVLIRDKHNKNLAGFGFVELATTELASSLLAHLLSRDAQPVGFVIDGRPIASSFANTKAFVSAGEEGGSIAWTIGGGVEGGLGGEEGWVRYWDTAYGASELVVHPGFRGVLPDPMLFGYIECIKASVEVAAGEKKKDVVKEGLLGGKMVPVKIGLGTKKETGMVPLAIGNKVENTGNNILGGEDEEMEQPETTLASRTVGKYIVPSMTGSRKTLKNINKWNVKQEELKAAVPSNRSGPPAGVSPANLTSASQPVKAKTVVAATTIIPPTTAAAPDVPAAASDTDFDYTDPVKMACLLCQRQFKSMDVLGQHTMKSDLHKRNLADPSVCEAGIKRKEALPPANTPAEAGPVYRDRAAERRTVFNQPSIPLPEAPRAGTKRKFAEGPPPPPPRPEPGLEPGKDEKNVGNQLLKKMGWTEGTGLGAEGSGRVDPVQALLFAERAGIGAGKGRDPVKYQGADGYSSLVKDGARDRYDRSGGQN